MNVKVHKALSQVLFVHDYLQLVFEDQILTILNAPDLTVGSSCIVRNEAGFCDALVALMGQRVVAVSGAMTTPLSLRFERGALLRVPVTGSGPEAWTFYTNGDPPIVCANV